MKNNNFDAADYPVWNLETKLDIPPRTSLYSLPPASVGTADVECLRSYVARLAFEYCVPPNKLLIKLLDKNLSSLSDIFTHLTGTNKTSQTVVNLLQIKTMQSNVVFTTLLPWSKLIANYNTSRKYVVWCAECFREQKEAGLPNYEKLLWTIPFVKVCSRHNQPLYQNCPRCYCKVKLFSANFRPGYCINCLYWLGNSGSEQSSAVLIQIENIDKEIIIADQVGEFLAAAVRVNSDVHNSKRVSENLRTFIKAKYFNNNRFAADNQIPLAAVNRFYNPKIQPSLELVVKISTALNIFPSDLFLTENQNLPEANTKRNKLDLNETNNGTAVAKVCDSTPKRSMEVKKELEKYLNLYPPISAAEAARRTRIPPSSLAYQFPEICAAFVKQYKAFRNNPVTSEVVERELKAALEQSPPPSLQSIFVKLKIRGTGQIYRTKLFPDLCKQVLERYHNYRHSNRNLEAIEEAVKKATIEYPPNALLKIVVQCGVSYAYLRKHYPEEVKIIKMRYEMYRAKVKNRFDVKN